MNMEFKFKFTEEERITFLKKLGYQIETIKGVEEDDFFGSKEMIKYAIMVAYTERVDFENLDRYHLTDKFGLDNVFKRVFNDRCKEFLFKKI